MDLNPRWQVELAASKIATAKQMCPRAEAVHDLSDAIGAAVTRRDTDASLARDLIAQAKFAAAVAAVDNSLKTFAQDVTLMAIRRDAIDKPAVVQAAQDEVTEFMRRAQFDVASKKLTRLMRLCPKAPHLQAFAKHVSQVMRTHICCWPWP